MSRILAIESSHDACSVALWIDGQMKELFEQTPRSHAQRLLPMVDGLLADAGLTLRQLDAIAFSRGPGSFTGLRIAAGVTQGLAFGADLPVIPVSTLQTLATALKSPVAQYCAVAIDARMDEAYFAAYIVSPSGLIEVAGEQIVPVMKLSLPDAAQCYQAGKLLAKTEGTVSSPLDSHWHCVGSGWQLLPQAQSPWIIDKQAASLKPSVLQPRAEDVAQLASRLWSEGKYVSADQAQPVYLRGTGAWKKRDQQ